MTLTEAADRIESIAEGPESNSSQFSACKTASKLSKDKVFNLAAYLKYNFGPCLQGMTDADWMKEAEVILYAE